MVKLRLKYNAELVHPIALLLVWETLLQGPCFTQAVLAPSMLCLLPRLLFLKTGNQGPGCHFHRVPVSQSLTNGSTRVLGSPRKADAAVII